MTSPTDNVTTAETRSGLPRLTVLVCVGTRPEMIKLAPVVHALRARAGKTLNVRVVFTGQHRELLDQMAEFWGITADRDLNVMRPGQSLDELVGRLLPALADTIREEKPRLVIGQGDTSTVLATAMASFMTRVPFAHVEAGLRSGDMGYPFPEEGFRRQIASLTTLHLAPTEASRRNLLAEGVPSQAVHVVGNPVVDAILQTAARDLPSAVPAAPELRTIVFTVHRRENHGPELERLCEAMRLITRFRSDVRVVCPVHLNPTVRDRVYAALGDTERVVLTEPLGYGPFVSLLRDATLVVTDSGGLQEEAPALNIPVLVVRETTERPEGVLAGAADLVGTQTDRIVRRALELLDDRDAHAAMANTPNPYGDGETSERIAAIVADFIVATVRMPSAIASAVGVGTTLRAPSHVSYAGTDSRSTSGHLAA